MSVLTRLTSGAAVALMLASAAYASSPNTNTNAAAAIPAQNAVSPQQLDNNSYVTLSGTVSSITDNDTFELAYPGGTVKVDTNDSWPALFEAKSDIALRKGDRIVVTGIVDDNWFSKKEIDAYSISRQGSNNTTLSYSRPLEGRMGSMSPSAGGNAARQNMAMPYAYGATQYFGDDSQIALSGYVAEVKNDHEFILRYNGGTIQIDTGKIDIPDAAQISVGDQVSVQGKVDKGFFERREIVASNLTRYNFYSQNQLAR